MTEFIATFENPDTGMKTYVTVGRNGYHVSMQDTDSGEFVPTVMIYTDREKAIAEARKVLS